MRSAASLVLAVVVVSLTASSGAEAQIYQPGTQPIGHEGGITVELQDSRTCRRCHGNYAGAADDYEPYDSWRGSMMSHAARDPISLAAIAIAEEDLAPRGQDAADFCLRCHTPAGWLRDRATLPEFDASNPEYPERVRRDGPLPTIPGDPTLLANERDGIGCMVCHRMKDGTTFVPPSDAMVANAQLVLADGDDAATRRGPYTYEPGTEPMHPTVQDPFISSGSLCGRCHDIHNPILEGHRGTEPTGRPFAIERTYSEWLNSAFADRDETCQDCHMPEVSATACGESDPLTMTRSGMNRHDLNGGNVWVPLALAAQVRDLDPEAADHLLASSERARAMLQRAASLEIRASALEGTTATATVRVTNESGHKLPSGYPEGRRMWLEVAVVDSTGRVVAGSGLYDDDTDLLAHDAQLRTYEVRMGAGGVEGFHFALQDTLLEDTRIPPEGFRTPVEADIAPMGRDYSDGAGGYRNYDETSYTLSELCGEGTLTLRARLRYQTTTREYIEFLRDNADAPSVDPQAAGRSWGAIAYDAWQMHGGDQPVDMEEVTVELGPSPVACPEPDGGPVEIDAGIDAGPPVVDAGDHVSGGGGCSCRIGDRGNGHGPLALAAGIALALLVRRRRR